jgi:hypothetical protein
VLAVAATSILPDADYPKSWLGHQLGSISEDLNHLFGHRSFLHSLLALVLITAVLGLPLWWLVSHPAPMVAVGVGYGSHLFADMMTLGGVQLFWGLRGGGGNFGIVTAFEYRLHPVGPIALGGPIFWPIADAPEVLRFLRDFAPEAPDELGITVALRLAPPMPFLPTEQYGEPVLGLVLVWAGDPNEGHKLIASLRQISAPLAELVRPVPYLSIQSVLDGGAPHGMRYYWKSHRVPRLSDEVIDVIVSRVESITSPFSQIGGWAVGGQPGRPGSDGGGPA